MQLTNFIRNRQSARAALAACALVVLVFFLNELRCVRYGCLRRTGFTGGWGQEEMQSQNASPGSEGVMEGKTLGWTGGEDAGPFGVGEKETESQGISQPAAVVVEGGAGSVGVKEWQAPAHVDGSQIAGVGGGDGGVIHGGGQGAGVEAGVVQTGHVVQSGGAQNMGLGLGLGLGMGVAGLDGT
ncbi:hypothetical protein BU16DRAFT_563111 [Lophium mytilinum]|uniref:Uncharacterized protein n=1 Tax=Lophium mytilinum TaxID=390894 RepID=A0A6A6QPU7_9PEZI|nr:hypothetical protein BU16DRAFT_563111 [Lophium mytilinum]